MLNRAIRRHHRERLTRRWAPLIRWMWGLDRYRSPLLRATKTDQEVLERQIHIHLKTRKPCSCYLCSGHRRWLAGPTRQELLDQLSCREQMDCLLNGVDEQIEDFWLGIPFYGEDLEQLADEGLNAWLVSLPDDDWGDAYDRAVPVHWDAEKEELVNDLSS